MKEISDVQFYFTQTNNVLNEVKDVLMQFDPRLNGMCYNPGSEDCECTLCKINKLINK